MFIPDSDFLPIPYPGSWIRDPGSRIPDSGSKNLHKKERGEKISVIPFFVATNLTKFKIILFLKC
jgi:hypothetical protein